MPYGSHAESALAAPASNWYFAEGATHGAFDLFYLVQNPSDQPAEVDARFLRGPTNAGSPVSRHYTVGAHQRLTINADFIPGLEGTDVSGEFHSTNGTPIIVERAMYMSRGGELWTAGIDGTGVTTLGTNWFLAEGATGTFFDTFIQVANPSTTPAQIRVPFQLPFGQPPVQRDYTVPALQRLTIPVEQVGSALAATSVSIAIASTNAVPVVAERSMWWPGSDWYEGHATLATNTTGTAWGVADGITGGPDNARTYLLVASGASATNDSVRVILVATRCRRSRDVPRRVDAERPPDARPRRHLPGGPRRARRRDRRVDGPELGRPGHADADRRRTRDVQRRQRHLLGRRLEPRRDSPSLGVEREDPSVTVITTGTATPFISVGS